MCGQLLCGIKEIGKETIPFYSPKKVIGLHFGPEFIVKYFIVQP